MEIIQKNKDKVEFKADINHGLANAIRRSVLEIPILAIDDVEFHKNGSVLYDKFLGLRLGLLPLKTTDSLKEDSGYKLKLKGKGPGTIYAKDIESRTDIVYPEMPIVKLVEGQEIELTANARLGKGVDHTKHSPGMLYYTETPEVKEINKGYVEKSDAEVKEVDKKEFEDIKEEKGKIVYDYLGEIVKNGDSYLYVEAGNEIIFTVESWGQISPEKMVEKAVDELKNNLEEVKKAK